MYDIKTHESIKSFHSIPSWKEIIIMAVIFENKDVIITEELVQLILERHVTVPRFTKNTSVFFETFNLVSTLASLTSKTWRGDETY